MCNKKYVDYGNCNLPSRNVKSIDGKNMKEWEYEVETEDLHSVDLRNFIFPFH